MTILDNLRLAHTVVSGIPDAVLDSNFGPAAFGSLSAQRGQGRHEELVDMGAGNV
jgi:hypothetical protein